jgi:Cdc6-like AAA superfamily ATPase
MGRVGIYFKDKIEREIRDILQQDLQKGANAGEANISATCNELVRLGLLVYKSKARMAIISISKDFDATS